MHIAPGVFSTSNFVCYQMASTKHLKDFNGVVLIPLQFLLCLSLYAGAYSGPDWKHSVRPLRPEGQLHHGRVRAEELRPAQGRRSSWLTGNIPQNLTITFTLCLFCVFLKSNVQITACKMKGKL